MEYITLSGKSKKVIIELICFLLLLNFFYEGIYKIAHLNNYRFWVTHSPFLRIKPIGNILTYVIPVGEILLSIAFIFKKHRKKALYITIGSQVVFILWIMSVYLFTGYLFWPYHALWNEPTWMQEMIYGLVMSWLAFMAIILSSGSTSIKIETRYLLRNKPAN